MTKVKTFGVKLTKKPKREDFVMYGMDKGKLQLMPHDAAWKEDFLREKQRIAFKLDDSFVRIEHVGSTSIPTVWAKPILDIAVLCAAQNFEKIIRILTELGYESRGLYAEKEEHYYAVLDRDNIRFCQAHIYTEANADWQSKLKFRDVLSQDAELAREYNDYKMDLARRVSSKNEYAEIKTKWVDTFILKVL